MLVLNSSNCYLEPLIIERVMENADTDVCFCPCIGCFNLSIEIIALQCKKHVTMITSFDDIEICVKERLNVYGNSNYTLEFTTDYHESMNK